MTGTGMLKGWQMNQVQDSKQKYFQDLNWKLYRQESVWSTLRKPPFQDLLELPMKQKIYR